MRVALFSEGSDCVSRGEPAHLQPAIARPPLRPLLMESSLSCAMPMNTAVFDTKLLDSAPRRVDYSTKTQSLISHFWWCMA